MDIESLREYCLSLPATTEDMAFGDEYLLMRVGGKIFACIGLERADYFSVKCDPDYAVELRDRWEEIEPAWHWNKKYWNQLSMTGSLPESLVRHLIRHSYSEVVRKLPRKLREQHPAMTEVNGRPHEP